MQPTGFSNRAQPGTQGMSHSGYDTPQSSAGYNQPAMTPPNTNVYNGGSVTYSQTGALQTTKPMPPATSGTMPTQQPPMSAMNGYNYNQMNYQQPHQYQQAPPNSFTQQSSNLSSTGSTSGHPTSMQYTQSPTNVSQPAPRQGMNYGPPPATSAGGGYRPPNYLTGPPPQTGTQLNRPPAAQQPSQMQQPTQMQQPPPQMQQQPPPQLQQPPPQMQQPPSQLQQPPPQMQQPPSQLQQLSHMQQPPSQLQQPPSQMQQPPSQLQQLSHMQQPPQLQQSPQLQQPPQKMQAPIQQMQNMQIGSASAQYPPPGGMPPPTSGMQSNAPGMPPSSQPPPPGISPSGYPPQPQPGLSGPGGMHPPYPNQQSAPAKRLDPDAMPSPVQVINDDKMNRSTEAFRTDGRGLVPPFVTTNFTVEDMGSASPRFIRCTTYNLPSTSDMAKTCQVPMSIIIKPLASLPGGEAPPLIVDPGPDGPIRCKRCKAYMCPQFAFTDGGRRFQCVFCNAITETPHLYFDHIDHMNQRVDKYRRPELCRGSYEFIATKDYCRNDKFPNPPAFIFAIDVSYNAVKSGFVELLCRQMRGLLDTLPRELNQEKSSIKVGFITYSNVLHFYNLNSSLAQPQMMVVSDVSDVFVPLQDGFLVTLEESRHVIESLLDQIPEMFRDTRETELVFAPVIQAAVQAVQSAECAGKLFMCHTSLPIGEAPGKLKNRDDRKLVGTDKEKAIFAPATNFYEKLGKDCVAQALSVDLFLFPNQYVDVATLGQIPSLTGGQLFKYNFFRAEIDGDRFIKDLAHTLQRDIVFDAVMRVRTSTGIRAVDFMGALYMSNTTDVELAAIDCDKSVHVELKHDDKIAEEYGAYVQVALLYTSVGGQRRLRLHNLNLSVCTQYADLYRSCETDVLINYLAKKAVKAGLQYPATKIREELISQASVILAMYRKHVASPSSPGQLILPECMKLVPVYLNCLLKNDAIHSSHDISTDDRAYLRQLIMSMDVAESQIFFYPKLMPLLFSTTSDDDLPVAVRCSEERLKDNEVYLLENGVSMFLWVGQSVEPMWIQNVFGVQSAAQIDIDLGNLLVFDNEDSRNIRDVVSKLQAGRTRQMKLTIVRQRDKLEPWFKHFLVEDRGSGTAASYVDFLCHMHKEIRELLS